MNKKLTWKGYLTLVAIYYVVSQFISFGMILGMALELTALLCLILGVLGLIKAVYLKLIKKA